MSTPLWLDCELYGIPHIANPVTLRDLMWDTPGVYAIKWADGSAYEYVGQARCLRSRLQNHEHGFTNCTFQLLAVGYTYEHDFAELQDRLIVEGEWITRLIHDGHDLLNNCHYAKAARKTRTSAPDYSDNAPAEDDYL